MTKEELNISEEIEDFYNEVVPSSFRKELEIMARLELLKKKQHQKEYNQKPEVKERYREYYEKNKVRIKERNRKYDEKNKVRIKAYKKEYYKKQKEKSK